MAKKATIKDVASRAGVAPSTVSYAFNGKRSISDQARKRIMDAVKILDYRPSYAAQLMKTSKTMSIGVAIDQCSNPATSRFMESLGQIMRRHGYHMILGVSGGNKEEGINIVRHFASGMVDGVINMLPGMSLLEAKQLCHERYAIPAERLFIEDGNTEGFAHDGFHASTIGYAAWVDLLVPYFRGEKS